MTPQEQAAYLLGQESMRDALVQAEERRKEDLDVITWYQQLAASSEEPG